MANKYRGVLRMKPVTPNAEHLWALASVSPSTLRSDLNTIRPGMDPAKAASDGHFSPGDQTMPATLLAILLLRAGIEQNPGPTTWFCSVCHKRIA